MSDESQNLAEVESAPAPEVTATTEIAQNAPEVAEQAPEQTEEKRFTQAELDAMISKRLARSTVCTTQPKNTTLVAWVLWPISKAKRGTTS